MITIARRLFGDDPPTGLNAEQTAALARLDADLAIAATAADGDVLDLHFLRRRAGDAYRNALAGAAGRPADPRWNVLAHTVSTFIARLTGAPQSKDAAAAIRRLSLLRLELRSDLLEERRGFTGNARVVQAQRR
jgi:hypothetical protein